MIPKSGSKPRSGHSRRVSGQELNLFNAIVGEQPILPPAAAERAAAERLEAATLEQAQKQQQRQTLRSKINIASAAPDMLKQIRQACHRGISLRVKRPHLTHWLRDMSDQLLHRLEEAQARLTAARQKVRLPEQRPQTVRFNGEPAISLDS
jgi:hypothetical protein